MNRHTRSVLVFLTGVTAVLTPRLCQAQTYTISTVAGGANPYFYSGTGDGGPATNAGLANPCTDVAADGAGNLYIASGTLVRKVTPDGNIATYAGGGTNPGEGIQATQAALAPVALATDSAGNLYIADTAFGIYRIRKVDIKGIVTTVAGGAPCCALGDGGSATGAYLAIPYGLAVDAAGNLYIAQVNGQNNLVRKVSTNGVITTLAGGGTGGDGGPAAAAGLSRPLGVAVDKAGNVYISEASGNRIRKVSATGIITTVAGNGAAGSSGDGGPAVKAAIGNPQHLAVDTAGDIFVTQINDARLRLITPDGNISTLAGNGTQDSTGDNGPSIGATLDHPAGIAVAGNGAVYIAQDSLAVARVRLLTPVTGPPGNSSRRHRSGLQFGDNYSVRIVDLHLWDQSCDRYHDLERRLSGVAGRDQRNHRFEARLFVVCQPRPD